VRASRCHSGNLAGSETVQARMIHGAGAQSPDTTPEEADEPQHAPQSVPATRPTPEAAGELAFHRLGSDLKACGGYRRRSS
jgi:hypothetical protein